MTRAVLACLFSVLLLVGALADEPTAQPALEDLLQPVAQPLEPPAPEAPQIDQPALEALPLEERVALLQDSLRDALDRIADLERAVVDLRNAAFAAQPFEPPTPAEPEAAFELPPPPPDRGATALRPRYRPQPEQDRPTAFQSTFRLALIVGAIAVLALAGMELRKHFTKPPST